MKKKLLAILLGTGLALTACSGAPKGEGQPSNPTPAASEQNPGAGETESAPTPDTAPGNASLLRDAKCTADESGAWSFDAYLVNDDKQERTFTVALAVTIGKEVKGHDMVIQKVPGKGEFHVTRNYFAQSDDADAVCEPVVSVEG